MCQFIIYRSCATRHDVSRGARDVIKGKVETLARYHRFLLISKEVNFRSRQRLFQWLSVSYLFLPCFIFLYGFIFILKPSIAENETERKKETGEQEAR